MKKLLGLIAIALVVIIPFKASAAVSISDVDGVADSEGIITAKIYMLVDEGEPFITKNINFTGQHAIIKSIEAEGAWTKGEGSEISADGTSAKIVLNYSQNGGSFIGTGEKVQILTVKYIHDPSYTGSEECKLLYGFDGSTTYTVVEKTTPQSSTGSMLPYVGIIAGVALIATAYVISKKSNKLYSL